MSKFAHLILPFIAGMMMANEGEIPEEEGGNMGEDSLCLKCESYNIGDRTKSCYVANSFEVFCKRNKVEAIIVNCKGFIEQRAIIIEEVQAEGQILAQTEAEAEEEMTKQAQEAKVQQEVKEKGGNDADHRTE